MEKEQQGPAGETKDMIDNDNPTYGHVSNLQWSGHMEGSGHQRFGIDQECGLRAAPKTYPNLTI